MTQNFERRISLMFELSQTKGWLEAVMHAGHLVAMRAAINGDFSILEKFKDEVLEKQRKFEELKNEWQTLDLLESAGVEVQN